MQFSSIGVHVRYRLMLINYTHLILHLHQKHFESFMNTIGSPYLAKPHAIEYRHAHMHFISLCLAHNFLYFHLKKHISLKIFQVEIFYKKNQILYDRKHHNNLSIKYH